MKYLYNTRYRGANVNHESKTRHAPLLEASAADLKEMATLLIATGRMKLKQEKGWGVRVYEFTNTITERGRKQ